MKKIRIIASLFLFFCLLATTFSAGVAAAPDASANNSLDKVIAEYTDMLAKNPNNAVAYYFRGRAYSGKTEYELAVSDLTKAVELNPRYAMAYFARGFAYSKIAGESNPSDKAIDDYSQAIRVDPSYAVAYSNRALHYNRKGQYDLAIEDTTKAIELNPSNPNPYFTKAFAYEKKQQYEEAITTLRAVMGITKEQDAIERAKYIIRSLGGTL